MNEIKSNANHHINYIRGREFCTICESILIENDKEMESYCKNCDKDFLEKYREEFWSALNE